MISNGQSLSLPATVPVPKDYAQKYDKGDLSTYGKHQVFTGPYMVKNDGKGNLTGYKAGRRIDLVRNPSWDAKTDYRPAYLDTISFLGGNDIDVASRRILSGKKSVSGDYAAPPVNVLRSALATRKDQVAIIASQGIRYIALNTTVKPFDDLNVRRAAAAVIDRNALRLTRGGATLGPIATHFIAPGVPGFEEAGGEKGTFDFMKNPAGDLKLAQEYMKKAGYASGKYTGPELLDGRRQPAAGVEHRRGRPEPAREARLQVQLPPGLAADDVLEVLRLAEGEGRRLPERRLGQGLLRRPVAAGPGVQRQEHRAGGQRQLGERRRSRAQRDARLRPSARPIPRSARRPTARSTRRSRRTPTSSRGCGTTRSTSLSEDVKGVLNRFNSSWDMSFTSLK